MERFVKFVPFLPRLTIIQINLLLFSLQATHLILMVGLFCKKKLTAKSSQLTIFAKSLPYTFDQILNTALGDIVKKVIILKIFPKLCNTFCVFILNMHAYLFYFVTKTRKKCYIQKEIKDGAFEPYLLTKETSS